MPKSYPSVVHASFERTPGSPPCACGCTTGVGAEDARRRPRTPTAPSCATVAGAVLSRPQADTTTAAIATSVPRVNVERFIGERPLPILGMKWKSRLGEIRAGSEGTKCWVGHTRRESAQGYSRV